MAWGILRLRMEGRPPIWPCKWNMIIYIVAKMFILVQSNRWKLCSYFHQNEVPVQIAPARITVSSPVCCKAFSPAKSRKCTQASNLVWIRLIQCNRGKGKVRLKLSLCMSWGHTGVVAVELHSFFSTRRMRASQPLYDQERVPCSRWIRGCVGFSIPLDSVEKRQISCPCRNSNPRSSSPQPRHYNVRRNSVKNKWICFSSILLNRTEFDSKRTRFCWCV